MTRKVPIGEWTAPYDMTLANPADTAKYERGDVLTFQGRPRWWRRAWAWIKAMFRKPPPPPTLTVVHVDHAAGVVTYRGAR